MKRVFLIVLDSFGIGEAPDSAAFGDAGSDTLGAIRRSDKFFAPNLASLGLFNIDGVYGGVDDPKAVYCRLKEKSKGKDTTTGHWEIAGIVSDRPMPIYPDGFDKKMLDEFTKITGRGILCNKPYSGTDVIRDYGDEHLKTGKLIVYTSADSVLQIAAHEDEVPTGTLYEYCKIMRTLTDVGRVIARPFCGSHPFTRTANRRDFSLAPPRDTLLDELKNKGYDVISVGKIYDIFASSGISEYYLTHSNDEGMQKTEQLLKTRDFNGLCFVNLVDFDSAYGHRNDVDGYAAAISRFDSWLGGFLENMAEDDTLIITADHGCDPSTESTDHSREYVPMLLYKKGITPKNLGTLDGFDNVSKFVKEIL